jgi:hypothetical protein
MVEIVQSEVAIVSSALILRSSKVFSILLFVIVLEI